MSEGLVALVIQTGNSLATLRKHSSKPGLIIAGARARRWAYAKGTVREVSQLDMPGRLPALPDEITLKDLHWPSGVELVPEKPQLLHPSRDLSSAARNVASLAAAPHEVQITNAYNRELKGVESRSPLRLDGRGCVGTQALPPSRDHSYAASNVASLAAVPHELAIANAYNLSLIHI